METIIEYVMSRSTILNDRIYGKRVGYGYLYFVHSIIEGQRMIDTTCDPLLASISFKTPAMNATVRVLVKVDTVWRPYP